ncbi:hypothetical protein IFM89_005930 [Coptis chinensis]|uniref:DUF4283 domain-containing protein n=1 Tax=Coptis chinensis TaxID=261450 RepID=A0A835IA83_9MAGN|nr:hypothetical protein IFM89_005930 [Coptis chinensis]
MEFSVQNSIATSPLTNTVLSRCSPIMDDGTAIVPLDLIEEGISEWMSTLEDKQMVLEGVPIFIVGKIFVIRPWSPEAENHRNKATTIPIWAKLSKVPKELWTKNGLSFLASIIGGPLYMDGATSMKQRLDFAKCLCHHSVGV